MASNKRQHQRIRAKGVAADVRARGRLSRDCTVENISMSGLLARSDSPLEVGAQVQMDLVRSGGRRPLSLSGCVIAHAEPASTEPYSPVGLRIQFDPLTNELTEQLRGLLAELGLPVDALEVPDQKALGASTRPPSDPMPAGDSRVMVQIRRLLVELGEAQGKLDRRTREAEDLVGELARLRVENADLKQRMAMLEEQLHPPRRKG